MTFAFSSVFILLLWFQAYSWSRGTQNSAVRARPPQRLAAESLLVPLQPPHLDPTVSDAWTRYSRQEMGGGAVGIVSREWGGGQ